MLAMHHVVADGVGLVFDLQLSSVSPYPSMFSDCMAAPWAAKGDPPGVSDILQVLGVSRKEQFAMHTYSQAGLPGTCSKVLVPFPQPQPCPAGRQSPSQATTGGVNPTAL